MERYQGVTEAGTKQHVGADTLFPAASLGKPVFAYAALRLAEQGKLDLDRPLKSYVPDHAPADPRGEKITARHVLSHSSGLRNWRNALDQPLVPDFDPGSRFQYSGEGFYYLQRAIEKIAGCAIQQFMEDALFRPFEMPSSTYAWRPDTDGHLVFGHSRGAVARGQRDFNRGWSRMRSSSRSRCPHSRTTTSWPQCRRSLPRRRPCRTSSRPTWPAA